MTLPFLTNIPTHIAASTGVTVGGFVLGDVLGGIGGGVAGAIAGAVVGLIGAILTALITMRKQNTEGAIAIDRERDAIVDRVNQVHSAEIAMLNAQHARDKELTAREKEFLQRQITYHEQLELAARKRLHAMVGEVQRCVTHIRLTDNFISAQQLTPPSFTVRTFDEIVQTYPLPEQPRNQP